MPDALTPQQEETLKRFRVELTEEGIIGGADSLATDEDFVLLRFLRARKWSLSQSKTMLKKTMEWRKSVFGVGMDETYKNTDPWEYPEREVVFKYWPMYFHKTDKKGRPLNIQSMGGIDTTSLHKTVSPERHFELLTLQAETLVREILPAATCAADHLVDNSFVIVDLKGFGLAKFWSIKSSVQQAFQISQDYYPETMGKLAIINAPYSFSVIWGVIKPWLSRETQEKIEILGPNYKETLLQDIDAENLPESLGGACTCEEHGGCALSNAGPWTDGRKERVEKWRNGERRTPGRSPREENVPLSTAVHPVEAAKTADAMLEKSQEVETSVQPVEPQAVGA